MAVVGAWTRAAYIYFRGHRRRHHHVETVVSVRDHTGIAGRQALRLTVVLDRVLRTHFLFIRGGGAVGL